MRQLLFILLNLLIYNTGSSQSIKIPYGKSAVMIDGKFNPAEWDDAIKVKLSDSLMLHFKQDHHYIYWCLQGMFQKPALRGVDFYITNNSTMINLHASAQLGERTLNFSLISFLVYSSNSPAELGLIGILHNSALNVFIASQSELIDISKSGSHITPLLTARYVL